jgi:competence protein ComEA
MNLAPPACRIKDKISDTEWAILKPRIYLRDSVNPKTRRPPDSWVPNGHPNRPIRYRLAPARPPSSGMTGEERKALTFVAALLGLSVLARAVNRPEPVVVAGAAAVDVHTRLAQNDQVRERTRKPAPRTTQPAKAPPPRQLPAWRRPGAGVVIDNRPPKGDVAAPQPVNINRATAAELDALPGVSPKVAASIVEYRTEKGAFSSIEQLDSVKGVGPALLTKLGPLVRFR